MKPTHTSKMNDQMNAQYREAYDYVKQHVYPSSEYFAFLVGKQLFNSTKEALKQTADEKL